MLNHEKLKKEIIFVTKIKDYIYFREIMLCLNVKTAKKIDEWYKTNKLDFIKNKAI